VTKKDYVDGARAVGDVVLGHDVKGLSARDILLVESRPPFLWTPLRFSFSSLENLMELDCPRGVGDVLFGHDMEGSSARDIPLVESSPPFLWTPLSLSFSSVDSGDEL
jgi:hypothetical protein